MASTDTYIMDLRARTAKLERDLDTANKKIRSKMRKSGQTMAGELSRQFQKLGKLSFAGIGLTAFTASMKTAIDTASQLQTTADKLGLTTSALQQLRYAAGQFNVTQQTTDMALQRFGRRIAEAAQGTGELKGTLEQYGIAVRDVNGNTRGTVDVLKDLANVIKDTGSSQEQLRIAFKSFDSEGAAFVNILRQGSEGLAKMQAEALAAGVVMDAVSVGRLNEANKRLKTFGDTSKKIFMELVAGGFDMTDWLGITGLENKLGGAQAKVEQFTRQLESMRNASNKDAGSAFAMVQQDLDEWTVRRDMFLEQIMVKNRDSLNKMGEEFKTFSTALFEAEPDSEAFRVLERQTKVYADAMADLNSEYLELIDKHPELEAVAKAYEIQQDNTLKNTQLTAEEMSKFNSIMQSAKTPLEVYTDKIVILGKAMEAIPDRAAEIQEAIGKVAIQYAESLKPDKMDTFLDEFREMTKGMSESISEAMVSGGDAVDRFLQRTLEKLASSQIENLLGGIFGDLTGGGILGSIGGLFGFGGGKAEGGPVRGNTTYLVGEEGPELFTPKSSGAIMPNNALAGGGEMVNVTNHLHFDVGLESVEGKIAQALPAFTQASQAAVADTRRRRPF